jgi:hypothetical protein
MNLNDLKYKAADFSDRTFGKTNPVTAPIHHLKEEVDELLECLENNTDPSDEFADCFLMLIDTFRKYYGNDVDMNDLIDMASKKLDVCETREWGEPDKNGVYKHLYKDKLYQFTVFNINGTKSITNIFCENRLYADRIKYMTMKRDKKILKIDITENNESN